MIICIVGIAILGLDVGFRNNDMHPVSVFFHFGVFYFIGLVGTRAIFKLLDDMFNTRKNENTPNILVYGGDDYGGVIVDWFKNQEPPDYLVTGIIVDDKRLVGCQIHGVKIVGTVLDVGKLIKKFNIVGVVVSDKKEFQHVEMIKKACENNNCWVKYMIFELKNV